MEIFHKIMKKPLSLLRVEAEYKELIFGENESVVLVTNEDGSSVLKYTLRLLDGYFKGHTYAFQINIPSNYPFSPPKAVCLMKVLHPSIDSLGRICLNITREDWSVQQGLQVVLFGISAMFYDVPTEDPFNKEAHEILMRSPADFIAEAQAVYNSNT
ncbi:hypothetical protein NERG_00422 [Nematocida ausubeli]|uniref:UBC core domain-containing protein n=1 Tax=Nematocida ausubeli (strain ATCC PRA-371 / ERTm2) TaxID=1913371 RepID=H8ZA01_NEMA1|nr:hypothetical protein NERG_00422 [Nematocida ausubeli]